MKSVGIVRGQKVLHWTSHSRAKMRQYRLSESRVLRVIHSPRRIEEGIAEKTIAMMQPASLRYSGKNTDWTQEIWVMIQEVSQKPTVKGQTLKVISAWRYPGRTKPGEPLPAEILRELRSLT